MLPLPQQPTPQGEVTLKTGAASADNRAGESVSHSRAGSPPSVSHPRRNKADYTAAQRMRKYRAKRTLANAIVHAQASGVHTIEICQLVSRITGCGLTTIPKATAVTPICVTAPLTVTPGGVTAAPHPKRLAA